MLLDQYFNWFISKKKKMLEKLEKQTNKLLNINLFTELFAVVVFFWFQNASIELSILVSSELSITRLLQLI